MSNYTSINSKLYSVKNFSVITGIPLRTVKYNCKQGKLKTVWQNCNGGKQYLINVEESYKNEPQKLIEFNRKALKFELNKNNKLNQNQLEDILNSSNPIVGGDSYADLDEEQKRSTDTELLFKAAIYNTRVARNYIKIFNYFNKDDAVFKSCEDFKDKLDIYYLENPDEKKLSHYSVIRKWKEFKKEGAKALIGKYGKNKGQSKVKDIYWKLYAHEYFDQNRRTSEDCYKTVLYWARNNDPEFNSKTFPSKSSFERLVKEHYSCKLKLREGEKVYGQKGPYIPRTKDDLKSGQIIVSDKVMLDVPVRMENGAKAEFVYATVIMDVKSTKATGWGLHVGAMGQETIMQAFYRHATHLNFPKKAILPETFYCDNGKDFRAKGLTGGKKKQILHSYNIKNKDGEKETVIIDEKRLSLMESLNIKVIFANPYNGRAKPIERQFGVIQRRFSKNIPGYRGNKIDHRPDNLSKVLKSDDILSFDELVKLFDDYMINDYNKDKCTIDGVKYESRNQAWDLHYKEERPITLKQLDLIAGKRSEPIKLGRNGITQTINRKEYVYYADWLEKYDNETMRVILITNINDFTKGIVLDAKTEEWLGDVEAKPPVPFNTKSILVKEHSERLAKKKKKIKEFKKGLIALTYDEKVKNKRACQEIDEPETKTVKPNKVIKPVKTIASKIDKQRKEAQKEKQLRNESADFITKPMKRPEKKKYCLFPWELEEEVLKGKI